MSENVYNLRFQEENPTTIQELKEVVENFARGVSKETLLTIADNFMKRAQFCYRENGGHFEHLLKRL